MNQVKTMINDLIEFEINYFFVSPEKMRATLEELKAEQVHPAVLQTRLIYTIPEAIQPKLKDTLTPYLEEQKVDDIFRLLPYGNYLRLRNEVNDSWALSIKVHASKYGLMTDQKEAESWISKEKIQEIRTVLGNSDFTLKNYQENYREKWKLSEECTLTIDWWPHLKPYVEIEGTSEATVLSWAEKLDLVALEEKGEVQSTFASVSEMYAYTYGIDPSIMLSEQFLTFKQTPSWVQ